MQLANLPPANSIANLHVRHSISNLLNRTYTFMSQTTSLVLGVHICVAETGMSYLDKYLFQPELPVYSLFDKVFRARVISKGRNGVSRHDCGLMTGKRSGLRIGERGKV